LDETITFSNISGLIHKLPFINPPSRTAPADPATAPADPMPYAYADTTSAPADPTPTAHADPTPTILFDLPCILD
jgi:hypothetical protein